MPKFENRISKEQKHLDSDDLSKNGLKCSNTDSTLQKTNSIILEAINISHSFDVLLLDNISLSLNVRESVAIMGVSGSGKSTLLHILSTLLPPKKGEVKVFNDSIYKISDAKKLELRRYKIGIIFQSHYLFRGFDMRENLAISSILSGKEIDNDILDRLEIKDLINQQIGTLSGGQQQRLSIARVLTKKPKILFADEPTGNLDKHTSLSVMNAMLGFIKDNDSCLVISTHDENIAKMCDKVYRLESAKLLQWN